MNDTRYVALCLDPVHVGAGGYRLGRVDMSIIREPATGVPKIPGTSLAGAVRAYAELARAEDASLPDIEEVFGTTEKQGMLRFYDAEVVLFPVSSNLGTVWMSTSERLTNWLVGLATSGETLSIPEEWEDENNVLPLKGLRPGYPVHLGWLLLPSGALKAAGTTIRLPPGLGFVRRLVLVSDKLFQHLVNDHLEVRTSVSIDDKTGAAKDGALFTYEALPRGTIIGFEVGIDGRRGVGLPDERVTQLLKRAFGTLKLLGVGGMGTRGFGRLHVLEPTDLARSKIGSEGEKS